MTRFARAKGSKSSNARVAEEATKWTDFKQQNQHHTVSERDHKDEVVKNAFNKIRQESQNTTDWADFGVSSSKPEKKKSKKRNAADAGVEGVQVAKKKKTSKQVEECNPVAESQSSPVDIPPEKVGKKKKNKKGLKNSDQQKGNKQQTQPPKDGTSSFKRRKPYVEFSTISINGISINISKFDGFDVKHEDAVRLKETRTKMLKAGIPRAEVDLAIKRERRNAEKALSREKKKVCFNCRISGHTLSECPELGSLGSKSVESTGMNICYKCGSTEHTHFQCKVEKQKKYNFATCFICKEQGHISSQCPDNPKGLYPQGGCCKVCGEVTHLKKDCPQISKDRSENDVTLDTIASNSNLESLGEEVQTSKSVKKSVKQKKVVKF